MWEEYKTMNRKLSAPAALSSRVHLKIQEPRHAVPRARIPAIILAICCMALVFIGAGVYFKTTQTVFGTAVQQAVSAEERLNGTTEMWVSTDFAVPEGTADHFILGTLGETDKLTSGLLLLMDGRVLLREEGQEDKDISDDFVPLPATEFDYAPLSSEGAAEEAAQGTVLAECRFSCMINDKLCPVTLTRLRDADGFIGYAVQYESLDGVGVLYNSFTFNAGCALDYVLGFNGAHQ